MSRATIGTYNLRYDTPDHLVRGDLATLASWASVLVLTEAGPPQDEPVDAFVAAHGWRQFSPKGQDVRITWDHDIWHALDLFGAQKVTDRGPRGTGVPAKWTVWQALEHRPSATRHLFIGAHLVSGYAGERKGHQEWRDAAAQSHLLHITQVAAHVMRTRGDIAFHHLCGDLNSQARHRQEWWYPSRMLESLWKPDSMDESLDWLLHSRLAADHGMKTIKRWAIREEMDSDHHAHLKRLYWPTNRL